MSLLILLLKETMLHMKQLSLLALLVTGEPETTLDGLENMQARTNVCEIHMASEM